MERPGTRRHEARRRAWPARAAWVLLAASAASSGALTMSGRLELVRDDGSPFTGAALDGGVVAFVPDGDVVVEPLAEPAVMTTSEKAFVPRVLAVPMGSVVAFPNADPILHNVFSVSGSNRFDLGLYRQGPGKAVRLDRPGVVRVFCNVHHAMVGYVLVLETSHFAFAGSDGRFELSDLPDTSGRLVVWHERSAEQWEQKVDRSTDLPVVARLVVDRERIPLHRNKLGEPYRESRGRGYR